MTTMNMLVKMMTMTVMMTMVMVVVMLMAYTQSSYGGYSNTNIIIIMLETCYDILSSAMTLTFICYLFLPTYLQSLFSQFQTVCGQVKTIPNWW